MNGTIARRKMIEIARRRRSRGSGSDIRTLMLSPRTALDVNIAELFGSLPYVIVGGVATRSYMPERFTKDVDVLVPATSYAAATEKLDEKGLHAVRDLRFVDSSLGLFGAVWSGGGEQLDLISSAARWADEAFTEVASDGSGLRVITLPYLILMKLDASRPQDTADISRMLALASGDTIERTRDVLRRYARDTEAIDDMDALLEIGRWELG